ncbi:MAG TPA: hypothetical protein VL986_02940 [Terracidiphilus sp.]|nr:hypothetical protein [Terracidiphilus sp.]
MKRLIVLAAALSACTSFACAQFKYCSIDYPAGFGTYARGINNRGQIIGSYNDQNGNLHALLIQGDTFIPLAPTSILGTQYSDAYKINDLGDVVGVTYDSNGGHGFLYTSRNGKVTLLDYPGAVDTYAWGINDFGEVVGWYEVPDSSGNLFYHGFKWANGHFSELTYPGSGDTYATGNNNWGAIVGGWDTGLTATSEQGFVSWFGQYFNYVAPNPKIAYTQPNDINNLGLVVGEDYTAAQWQTGDGFGFLAIGREFIQLNFPGSDGTTAWGINDESEIVGNWYDANNLAHGWLVRPDRRDCPSFQVEGSSWSSSTVLNPAVESDSHAATLVSPATGQINIPERLQTMQR